METLIEVVVSIILISGIFAMALALFIFIKLFKQRGRELKTAHDLIKERTEALMKKSKEVEEMRDCQADLTTNDSTSTTIPNVQAMNDWLREGNLKTINNG
jgi:type II secretory pathway pseudopilin PulG